MSNTLSSRFSSAGFGQPGSAGLRPGLLIIDVQYRTVGTDRKPYWEAIKEYPTACGEDGWRAVDHIQPLLAEFRKRGLPVLYPHVAPKNVDTDSGRLAEKVPSIMGIDAAGYRFVDEVAPVKGDVLLPKKHPSAFFGTPLVSKHFPFGEGRLVVARIVGLTAFREVGTPAE